MDAREKRLLRALALMVQQYLEDRGGGLMDSYAMSAGEAAIEALAEHGLMEVVRSGRIFGQWTEAANKFLKSPDTM